MATARRSLFDYRPAHTVLTNIGAGSSRRREAEAFVHDVFARCYGADVATFAPNLALLEQQGRVVAAAGWRSAECGPLFLERYLDAPIEDAVTRLAGQPMQRSRIVEVGNLAADKSGISVQVILLMAEHLDRLGYEWVVFTATRELLGIFSRLGLPLLALAPADPTHLGEEAATWGTYYDTLPIVVAGRIRLGLERAGRRP
jgi:hypothetical protein